MDRSNRLLRSLCMVLVAALMAGCAACLLVRAFGLSASWIYAYAAALYGAALVRLGRRGMTWSMGAAALLLIPCAFLLAARGEGLISAFRTAAQGATEAELAAYAAVGSTAQILLGALLGALFALLLGAPSGAAFVLAALLAAMICALALNEDISLWAALPGFVGGVCAFTLRTDVRRGGRAPPAADSGAGSFPAGALAFTCGAHDLAAAGGIGGAYSQHYRRLYSFYGGTPRFFHQ